MLPEPEISVIAQSQTDFEAANLLIKSLGLVQIEVVESSGSVSPNAHTLIWLGSESSTAAELDIETRFLTGASEPTRMAFDTKEFRLLTTFVPTCLESESHTPKDRFIHAAFWMDQRLIKRANHWTDTELDLWRLICGIAISVSDDLAAPWHTINEHLSVVGTSPYTAIERYKIPSSALANRLLRALPRHNQTQIKSVLSGQQMTPANFTRACQSLTNSISIMALAISLWLSGESFYLQKSMEVLARSEWSHPRTSFPRVVKGGDAFAYSPVALLWLYLLAFDADAETLMDESPLYLKSCSLRGHLPVSRSFEHEAHLGVARAAWNLWRSLHKMPQFPGRQILLSRESYSNVVHELETYWLETFQSIQDSRGRVLCRVLPWPEKKQAALTLRFDVDRNLTKAQVDTILSIQRKHSSQPSGSWYFWEDDQTAESWRHILEDANQEMGLHSLDPLDVRRDIGVTHHSAPVSTYWRGDGTMKLIDQSGALYGEFLGHRIPTPRPMLLPDSAFERKRSRSMFTGPSFPLEESTADTSLAFFDKLIREFRSQLAQGGHAIVTTHPDLNMALLDELLEREDLENVWITSTQNIVTRLSNLLHSQNLNVKTECDGVSIWSSYLASDVQVQMTFGKSVKTFSISISPNPVRLRI